MPTSLIKYLCLAMSLLALPAIAPPPAPAQQLVEMIPLRIIMEGRERSTTLRLINRNPQPVTYRLETIILRQEVSGGTQRATDLTPAEQRILEMIRFAPRQVRIEPNTVQTVRIMARKPADLPAGEYRAHLQVTPLPPADQTPREQGVRMGLLVSTSIPIIIRHGETKVYLDAQGLELLELADGRQALKTRIIADGNRSAFLDAALFHGDNLLAEMRGFAVYQPNGQREIIMPLQTALPPAGSKLRLLLNDREKRGEPLVREVHMVFGP